jgi:pimeloyl-ACP methyl ester carboxylesterase
MTSTRPSSDRQPVVLLHSGGMSSRQWRKLGDALAASHRVVAPDFLGSGDNPPWPDDQPFDVTQDVDMIGRLLEGLGEPAHLVGHSYGGLVALTVARRAPARVRSLTVYDPVAFGVLRAAEDAEGLRDLARAEGSPLFTDAERGGDDGWFEVFVDYWNGAGAWRALAPAARESFLRVGRKVFHEVCSLMKDRTPASAYAVVDASALLLGGEQSPAAARRVVALLAEALPRARAQTVAGAGHMGPLTHAAIVNEMIAGHITGAS